MANAAQRRFGDASGDLERRRLLTDFNRRDEGDLEAGSDGVAADGPEWGAAGDAHLSDDAGSSGEERARRGRSQTPSVAALARFPCLSMESIRRVSVVDAIQTVVGILMIYMLFVRSSIEKDRIVDVRVSATSEVTVVHPDAASGDSEMDVNGTTVKPLPRTSTLSTTLMAFLTSFVIVSLALGIARTLSRIRRAAVAHQQLQMRMRGRRSLEDLPPELRRAFGAQIGLMMMDRDFDENDYERLLELDENRVRVDGASQGQVNRLPTFVFGGGEDAGAGDVESGAAATLTSDDEDDDVPEEERKNGKWCSICLERFKQGQQIKIIPCFHQFHTACIDPWLLDRGNCPICKESAKGDMTAAFTGD